MIKQAIIPLAGLGTRVLPLTSVFPKELLPINGKPGIEYILDVSPKVNYSQVGSSSGQRDFTYSENEYSNQYLKAITPNFLFWLIQIPIITVCHTSNQMSILILI